MSDPVDVEPASVVNVTETAPLDVRPVRVPTDVIWDWAAFTEMVFPDSDSPVPAMISPAPENCVNARPFVPTVADVDAFETTHPLDALVVPCSMNTNDPAAFDPEATSVDLVGAPLAATTYIPFSVVVA
jgi:hypothetical protein